MTGEILCFAGGEEFWQQLSEAAADVANGFYNEIVGGGDVDGAAGITLCLRLAPGAGTGFAMQSTSSSYGENAYTRFINAYPIS